MRRAASASPASIASTRRLCDSTRDRQVAEAADRRLGAELHVLLEERPDVGHRPQEVAVPRRLREGEVELDVGVRVVVRASRRPRSMRATATWRRLDLLGRRALRRPGRRARARSPRAPRSAPRPPAGRAARRSSAPARRFAAVDDVRAAAGPRLDQPLADQHADRLAHRADADRERRRELPVAGKLRARVRARPARCAGGAAWRWSPGGSRAGAASSARAGPLFGAPPPPADANKLAPASSNLSGDRPQASGQRQETLLYVIDLFAVRNRYRPSHEPRADAAGGVGDPPKPGAGG